MSEDTRTRPSDIGLLTGQMAKGDEGAYRRFYESYFNRLLRYLLVVTNGNEQAARDALQGTFLRVVRHVKRFESEETFWSWLTVLARSAVIDQQRKEKRYRGLLERFFQPAPPVSNGSQPDADAPILALLKANMGTLAPEERDLVERKYFENQSVREIAQALGSTEKAIDSRLVRIRRQLKEKILKGLRDEN
jgi:RNA polymerase sigma-70 factor (ECF subfamily)